MRREEQPSVRPKLMASGKSEQQRRVATRKGGTKYQQRGEYNLNLNKTIRIEGEIVFIMVEIV